MLIQQRTIQRPASYGGVGLHTGSRTTITFKPAPENYGYRFVRTDLPDQPEVPANVDHVVSLERGTTIEHNGGRVHTVEHVLAALVGLQIDNVRIELDGPEPPVGDGSAQPYVEALMSAGFQPQQAPKDYLVIDQTIQYSDEQRGVELVALPLDDYRITVMVDYNNAALGSQHSGLFNLEKEFATEFAPARTFCFLHEVEALSEAGLIRGGNLDNALVIVDRQLDQPELDRIARKIGVTDSFTLGESGIVNNKTFRFKNEPARHKLLDVMGDLALIGVPLKAQILAARPGHAANIEFARKIRKLYQQRLLTRKFQHEHRDGVVFDTAAIMRILPHRYPFLLVDKIVEFEMEQRCVGVKGVTMNEPFFQGHFPGHPIMPGVLILEAMAQTGGVLLLNGSEEPDRKLVYFMAIDGARFRRPVVPGDQLTFELSMKSRRAKMAVMTAKAYVRGQLVCEAELMASIVDKPA